mmetsp:Transcript_13499/g.17584  ORF Transcript_13499/g.17584 Transcript_13499/m.17584 type:complete len:142 (-) Transcript_13499:615-1040(-)
MSDRLSNVLVPLLKGYVESVPGLETAIISSSNGSCIAQYSSAERKNGQGHKKDSKEESQKTVVVASFFPFVAEQVSKLCSGNVKSLTAFYEDKSLVHVNLSPLVVSFIGSSDMSTGALTDSGMLSRLEKGLGPLRSGCPSF